MAMEKAILASDVGGHKELIENEKTGVLFAADSADDMIDRASQLAREPNLRQRLGQAGRRYVIQQRAWSELVQCYLPIYDEALRTTRLAHKTQGSHVEQPPVSI
jgi:glycosyltransferase involved in cell wall biosynthesis